MIYRSFKYKHLQKSLNRLGLEPNTAFACISEYLFKPKLPALDLITQYTSVLALPTVFSVGIHIRTGDQSMRDAEYDKVNTGAYNAPLHSLSAQNARGRSDSRSSSLIRVHFARSQAPRLVLPLRSRAWRNIRAQGSTRRLLPRHRLGAPQAGCAARAREQARHYRHGPSTRAPEERTRRRRHERSCRGLDPRQGRHARRDAGLGLRASASSTASAALRGFLLTHHPSRRASSRPS